MKKQTHLHLGWPEDDYIFILDTIIQAPKWTHTCKWGQTIVGFNKNRFTHHWCGTLSLWCLPLHLHCICSRLFTTFIHTDGHEDRLRSVFVAHEDAVVPRVLHGHVVYSESGGFILVFNVILAGGGDFSVVLQPEHFRHRIAVSKTRQTERLQRERISACFWCELNETQQWWMDVPYSPLLPPHQEDPLWLELDLSDGRYDEVCRLH